MAKDSLQKKLSRVRPPRVHITYDVEKGDAKETREIPFVVGVLADLSGMPQDPLPAIKNRKFVEIDRDNFNHVLAKIGPRLAVKVDNRLTNDDTKLGIELRFKSLEEFEPAAVAQQIPALRKLLEARNALHNLRTGLIGNDKLDSMLQEVISSTQALRRITAEGSNAAPQSPEAKE